MARKEGSNQDIVGRDVVERTEKVKESVKEKGEPAPEPASMKVVVVKR